MSDIKLFRISNASVTELASSSVAVEKSLQALIERHLEAFLGVRFLASEYSTGKTHGGRIDTLGIDENGYPVIVEYKRALNEDVINQGLYYLNWLMDHKTEFTLLVMVKVGRGRRTASSGARLASCKTALCTSGRCWVRTSDLCRVKAELAGSLSFAAIRFQHF